MSTRVYISPVPPRLRLLGILAGAVISGEWASEPRVRAALGLPETGAAPAATRTLPPARTRRTGPPCSSRRWLDRPRLDPRLVEGATPPGGVPSPRPSPWV